MNETQVMFTVISMKPSHHKFEVNISAVAVIKIASTGTVIKIASTATVIKMASTSAVIKNASTATVRELRLPQQL